MIYVINYLSVTYFSFLFFLSEHTFLYMGMASEAILLLPTGDVYSDIGDSDFNFYKQTILPTCLISLLQSRPTFPNIFSCPLSQYPLCHQHQREKGAQGCDCDLYNNEWADRYNDSDPVSDTYRIFILRDT